ncbi:MAG: HAMP domain-containing sensor histidine kinase [Oscillospiraceae bacterium]
MKIFGKTIFSRVFMINLASVLVGIVILGSLQMILITNYITKQNEESLSKNADSIVNLINNEISLDSLSSILRGFSKSSNTHILVLDNESNVLLNTRESGFIDKDVKSLSKEYSKDVISGKRNSIMGTMGGLFNQSMFTLQVPIFRPTDNAIMGAVLISTPIPERQKMNMELFRILLFSAAVVFIVSFLLSYMLARKLSDPIKRIGKTAKEFATGKFTARADLTEADTQIMEISELAETFNNMAYELEKFEDIRMSFISNVSHELRTPMTTISGFIDGILDETIPPDKQSQYLEIVRSEIVRLSKLVNTFLDITRMKSDKMAINRTNFDINEVIRLTIISFEKKLEAKNINVNLEFGTNSCYVKADSDTIKIVWTNLIDNAIKFTNDGGDLTISVTTKLHDVFVSVKNTGVGIPENQQHFIFERLYKVDKSRAMNREGTGIGLYLVKSVIQAHGKEIKVNSVENEYAEFVFNLSRGKAPNGRGENRGDIEIE